MKKKNDVQPPKQASAGFGFTSGKKMYNFFSESQRMFALYDIKRGCDEKKCCHPIIGLFSEKISTSLNYPRCKATPQNTNASCVCE